MGHSENRSEDRELNRTTGPETTKNDPGNRRDKNHSGINTVHSGPVDQKRKAEENRGDRAFGGNEELDITV